MKIWLKQMENDEKIINALQNRIKNLEKDQEILRNQLKIIEDLLKKTQLNVLSVIKNAEEDK